MDSTLGRLSGLGLINSLGSKRTKDFSLNKDTIEKVGGDYAGAVKTMEEVIIKYLLNLDIKMEIKNEDATIENISLISFKRDIINGPKI